MVASLSSLRSNLTSVEPTQFVAGIYPRKQLTIIASAPGVGKTWYIIRQGLDIAQGGAVFCGEDTTPLRVLTFCGEAGDNIMSERIQAMGMPGELIPQNYIVYTLASFAKANIDMCLDDPDGMRNFEKIIAGEKPDIVFIDTLISFRAEDENASKETSRLLNRIRANADKHNCAIVIMHHVRKRKLKERYVEGGQDEIIGSSAFTRLCAVAYMLSEEPLTHSVAVRCVKSWYEKPDPCFWRIERVGDIINLVVVNSPDPSEQSFMAKCTAYINQLLQHEAISAQDLAEQIRCSEKTARRAIKKAVEDGIIGLYATIDGHHYYNKANKCE